MKMLSLILLAAAASAQENLPPKTMSKVCPAIAFNQEMVEQDGRFFIRFKAANPMLPFKFVDAHIVLENHQGVASSPQRNYPMQEQAGLNSMGELQSVYTVEVRDPAQLSALWAKRSDVTLRYSFTYCVGINGQEVDCDTEAYMWERFDWLAGQFPPCPTECGLPPSIVARPVACVLAGTEVLRDGWKCEQSDEPSSTTACPATAPCVTFTRRQALVGCPTECGLEAHSIPVHTQCMGSDGNPYPDEACLGIPAPADVFCPATPACVSFQWMPLDVACPTECGMPVTETLPEVMCMGSDTNVYSGDKCSHLDRPAAVFCPATKPCVTFAWEAMPVQCPIKCGLSYNEVLPDAVCMGSDGSVYPGDMCSHLPRPAAVMCPATKACVTFFWKATPVVCPTVCGLPLTEVLPDAVCMGSDGSLYPDALCAQLPFPKAAMCPATLPCVTYDWRAGLVECPTQCGLEQSVFPAPVACVGSDGELYDDVICAGMPKPLTTCPATKLCPLSQYCHVIEYNHKVLREGGNLKLVFQPYLLDQDIRRRHIEWVDVHIAVEDMQGNTIGPLMNHRMTKPAASDPNFDFTWLIPANTVTQPGHRLAYSFTYCIEMTDCDTDKHYFDVNMY